MIDPMVIEWWHFSLFVKTSKNLNRWNNSIAHWLTGYHEKEVSMLWWSGSSSVSFSLTDHKVKKYQPRIIQFPMLSTLLRIGLSLYQAPTHELSWVGLVGMIWIKFELQIPLISIKCRASLSTHEIDSLSLPWWLLTGRILPTSDIDILCNPCTDTYYVCSTRLWKQVKGLADLALVWRISRKKIPFLGRSGFSIMAVSLAYLEAIENFTEN